MVVPSNIHPKQSQLTTYTTASTYHGNTLRVSANSPQTVAPTTNSSQQRSHPSNNPLASSSANRNTNVLRERHMQNSEIVARVDPGSYVNQKVLDLQPNFDTTKHLGL